MLKKNDVIELDILDVGLNGEGIAKTFDGYTLFVNGATVGDRAVLKVTKTNKTYGFARCEKIITKSPFSCNVPCKSFDKCGGCTIMNLKYEKQLEIKKSIVKNNLLKIGGYNEDEYKLNEIVASENINNYRNKAQFPVGMVKNRAVCGFYEPKSHNVVSVENCFIQDEKINKIVDLCVKFFNKYKISVYNEKTKKGILRNVYVRNTGVGIMVVIVANSKKKLPYYTELTDVLASNGVQSIIQNINTKDTNVIMGDENIILYGEDKILAKIGDLKFYISSKSFFQVNTKQTENLYNIAKEFASSTKEDTVFDLFCGCGTISCYLANDAKKVIGVEIQEDAVKMANENAILNGIDNAFFYAGDCDKIVKNLIDNGEKVDVVVVDPPRKGLTENLIDMIVSLNPKRIVYVSCNSATLARDVKYAKEKGYILKEATPVDMFPHTTHCEVAAKLER